MLSRHLISFYEQADSDQYISMLTPLLLALKALISSSDEMKEELQMNLGIVNILIKLVSGSYGAHNSHSHLNLAGTILMSELGYSVFEKPIKDRMDEMAS